MVFLFAWPGPLQTSSLRPCRHTAVRISPTFMTECLLNYTHKDTHIPSPTGFGFFIPPTSRDFLPYFALFCLFDRIFTPHRAC